jgi:hypothetical protein
MKLRMKDRTKVRKEGLNNKVETLARNNYVSESG